MKDHFSEQGRIIKSRKDFGSNATDEGKCFCLDFKNLEDFLLVVKDIEDIDGIAKSRRYIFIALTATIFSLILFSKSFSQENVFAKKKSQKMFFSQKI